MEGMFYFFYNGLTGCLTKPLGSGSISLFVKNEECVGLKETGNGTILLFLPYVV